MVYNVVILAAKEVVKTIFAEQRVAFSQVVLVPFPHSESFSIGMVTNECLPEESDTEHEGLISVFVPATPNPTMGFMLMLKRNQLIFLEMKVEEAMKTIMSCGVVFSGESEMQKEQEK